MQCLRLCYPLCARHVHGKEVRELNTSAQDNRREVIPRSNQSPKRFGKKLCQKFTHLAIVNAPLVQPVLQNVPSSKRIPAMENDSGKALGPLFLGPGPWGARSIRGEASQASQGQPSKEIATNSYKWSHIVPGPVVRHHSIAFRPEALCPETV